MSDKLTELFLNHAGFQDSLDSEITSASIQFRQAKLTGRLRGDELRTIQEINPTVIEQLIQFAIRDKVKREGIDFSVIEKFLNN